MVTILAMAKTARIGPKRPVRVYIAQWRNFKGLTQEQLGGRLGVDKGTVSRWEGRVRAPDINVLAAICEALGIPPSAVYHPPADDSPEAMLAAAPNAIRDDIADYIGYLIRKHSA